MNCQSIRNAILALPDPRSVPELLRMHLAACAGCRAWAGQVARLESLLERLPVPAPPAGKKAALTATLTRPPTTGHRPGEPQPVLPLTDPEPGLLGFVKRNATLVGALAAAVLLAVGAWVLFPRTESKPELAEATPEHPFLRKITQRNVALARSESPREKFLTLAGLTEDLAAEAVTLARIASADDLKEIARWFDRVVKDGLVRQAERIPEHGLTPAERQAIFAELARQLGDTAARTEEATADVPIEAKVALERIRESARFGQRKMSELAGGR